VNKKIYLILLYASLSHAAIYVSTSGSDLNPGTITQPLRTIPKAVIKAAGGDTIFIRGGVHELTANVTIGADKSGTESRKSCLWGYPGERPLIDCSKEALGSRGLTLKASWWHFKDFDLKGAGDNGLQITGTTGAWNLVENCSFFECRDSGVQLSAGAHHNRFINCDSYYNADPPDYGDADGFAPKLDVGGDNSFYGCRAWGNCDDGWDGYMRGATDVTTTLENCWTWGNGWLKDGSDPGSQANGNGFKMGGGDNSNNTMLMHHFILFNCLAFNCKAKGFDQNNNAGSMTLYNCSGFGNQTANYRITRTLASGQTLTVKNCLSFNGNAELGSFAIQATNSWLAPFVVTAGDFVGIDPALASAPRKADGSLPDIPFMHLALGSDLIDGGTDLGLPFVGAAPDLGAFESDYRSMAFRRESTSKEYALVQNYPNPFNPETIIRFVLDRGEEVSLRIYNLQGQEVANLVEGWRPSGEQLVRWRPLGLAAGIFIARLQAGAFSATRRLVLAK
jgi:hypothetical protein